MKNISKANQKAFYLAASKELLKIGATKTKILNYDFVLPTPIGNLYLKIDKDESLLYTVFGNFIGCEDAAKEKFGHWKYNFHMLDEGMETVLKAFYHHINKTLLK